MDAAEYSQDKVMKFIVSFHFGNSDSTFLFFSFLPSVTLDFYQSAQHICMWPEDFVQFTPYNKFVDHGVGQ